jgi:hypothetical protein
MGIGQIDNETAVREGWVRDEDDEISLDGYNAFVQITTNDGTSGFSVKNSAGADVFSAKSDGDGYVAKRLGIKTSNPTVELEVVGKTKTNQFQMSVGAIDGYVFTSNEDGDASWLPSAGAYDPLQTKGKSFNLTLFQPGSSGDKWLFHGMNPSATNEIPIHFGWDVSLVGITYINKETNKDIDLEFYVNGTGGGSLVYTEEIRNAKRYVHTLSSGAFFDMNIGDTLAIFGEKVSGDEPSDVSIELLFIVRTDNSDNFSSNS